MSPEATEGRLMAQRRVLGMILARLDGGALLEEVGGLAQFNDHEEDPGVIPSEAYAIEAARADEFRLIVEEARRTRG